MEKGDVELIKLVDFKNAEKIKQIDGKYYYANQEFDALEIDRMQEKIKLSKLTVWKPFTKPKAKP